MNKEDELKLQELRDNRDILNKKSIEIEEQIRDINKQIDNIYFKDSNVLKYVDHIIYYFNELTHQKSLIWVKDIARLHNNIRIYGPAITWYNNEEFYYENQESIDVNQKELNKCIICDHLKEKFTNIRTQFNEMMTVEFMNMDLDV